MQVASLPFTPLPYHRVFHNLYGYVNLATLIRLFERISFGKLGWRNRLYLVHVANKLQNNLPAFLCISLHWIKTKSTLKLYKYNYFLQIFICLTTVPVCSIDLFKRPSVQNHKTICPVNVYVCLCSLQLGHSKSNTVPTSKRLYYLVKVSKHIC